MKYEKKRRKKLRKTSEDQKNSVALLGRHTALLWPITLCCTRIKRLIVKLNIP